MHCDFSYRHYREILEAYKNAGYVISSFKDYDETNPKTVILRHDLDKTITIKNSTDFSKIEQDLGVSATYFFRVHGWEYNLFDYKVVKALKTIQSRGHEIGLHYEIEDFKDLFDEYELSEILEMEKKGLEFLTREPVISISRHGITNKPFVDDKEYFTNLDPKEFDSSIQNNAYEDRFFKDMKYISDSNGNWREGCACQHVGKFDKMQILMHPELWFEESLLLQ